MNFQKIWWNNYQRDSGNEEPMVNSWTEMKKDYEKEIYSNKL